VIGQRRSVRRYLPASIDRTIIDRMLFAATRAPSAHNRQPWRFAVLDERSDSADTPICWPPSMQRTAAS
jgi:coenzyme F420-0:L-glutamate ligase/coenzyme F420-1:gamma-L-glutamate ligase